MATFSEELRRRVRGVSPEAMEALIPYSWPGNVRELENCVKRAVIVAAGETIQVSETTLGGLTSAAADPTLPLTGSLHADGAAAAARAERDLIWRILAETQGNKMQAAERLRVSYKTLLSKIKEYGVEGWRQRGC